MVFDLEKQMCAEVSWYGLGSKVSHHYTTSEQITFISKQWSRWSPKENIFIGEETERDIHILSIPLEAQKMVNCTISHFVRCCHSQFSRRSVWVCEFFANTRIQMNGMRSIDLVLGEQNKWHSIYQRFRCSLPVSPARALLSAEHLEFLFCRHVMLQFDWHLDLHNERCDAGIFRENLLTYTVQRVHTIERTQNDRSNKTMLEFGSTSSIVWCRSVGTWNGNFIVADAALRRCCTNTDTRRDETSKSSAFDAVGIRIWSFDENV